MTEKVENEDIIENFFIKQSVLFLSYEENPTWQKNVTPTL